MIVMAQEGGSSLACALEKEEYYCFEMGNCIRIESENEGVSTMGTYQIRSQYQKADEYLPLVGRAYEELPQFHTREKAISNLHNKDDRCCGYGDMSSHT